MYFYVAPVWVGRGCERGSRGGADCFGGKWRRPQLAGCRELLTGCGGVWRGCGGVSVARERQ